MAPHVAVVGYRNGYPVALHLREQLLQLRGNIDILPHPGQSIAEELTDYSSDDVAVIVGVGRVLLFSPDLSTCYSNVGSPWW